MGHFLSKGTPYDSILPPNYPKTSVKLITMFSCYAGEKNSLNVCLYMQVFKIMLHIVY